ncbi:unnamed protein product [Miscanthus lutarioriparius]|uniref:Protein TRIGALACTOSYLDIACYLGLYCEROL 1, chloroplastic n=1 Tax=Miscanthus lutarioriparius TaxID=422564 RepID=A0A811QZV5_9POAL|nr:unnamed protein product [Miscanthus lutarioriparius]
MPSAAALLLRPTSVTTHPPLHQSSRKSYFLRLHPSCRRRLPVPRLSLTPTTASNSNSSPPPPSPSPAPAAPPSLFSNWSPPRAIWRGLSALLLAGQVFHRVLTGRIHRRNLLAQLLRARVHPPRPPPVRRRRLALALARELSPVVTAVVTAGRVGSAFAAELGTMQVSEQTDTLRVLGAHPVDYLVVPRVLACVLALPVLTLISFALGLASSAFLADSVFGVSVSIILESARRALRPWDLISSLLKSQVFGAIIAVVSCAWGVTTHGGAKGVGESTTSAVVVSLVGIFVADFALSCLFFQGAGDSLKYAMG